MKPLYASLFLNNVTLLYQHLPYYIPPEKNVTVVCIENLAWLPFLSARIENWAPGSNYASRIIGTQLRSISIEHYSRIIRIDFDIVVWFRTNGRSYCVTIIIARNFCGPTILQILQMNE